MRVLIAAVVFLLPVCAGAESEAPLSVASPAPPSIADLPPGYIAVPLHDLRDAMIYLGARSSSDEIAGVIYRELANDAAAAQRAARATGADAATAAPVH